MRRPSTPPPAATEVLGFGLRWGRTRLGSSQEWASTFGAAQWSDCVGSKDPEALGVDARNGIVAAAVLRRESRVVQTVRPGSEDTHDSVDIRRRRWTRR